MENVSDGLYSLFPQTLSPYNKGLFRRAISQCGVALSPWALQKNPMNLLNKVHRSICHPWGRPHDFQLSLFFLLILSLCADCSKSWLLEN